MLRKIYQHEAGQAVAEFGLALLILLPLVFWMLRLGTLLNLKHEALEFARLAVWEKAYGQNEKAIDELIRSEIKNAALFSNPASLQVSVIRRRESSRGEFRAMMNIPQRLDLTHDNYYISEVVISGDLLLGTKFSVNGKYAMLADSWNLTDRNHNRRVDDRDLQESLDGIYFWPVPSAVVKTVLRTSRQLQHTIRNLPLVGLLLQFIDVEIDIEPGGHPRLNAVPTPSGN